ncbi:hypothetical protein Droror1_Dr00021565 [Drosera rotundifolia]
MCEVVSVFEAEEIDFEYEFEAVRFFDFCRRETENEVREAKAWFESARVLLGFRICRSVGVKSLIWNLNFWR